jgi:flagellin FlaB
MYEKFSNNDDRGQVGIGTLIVFIALVLVAAIAAGVLINTAGFLQNQAESTGQESTQQVSNNVKVISVTGGYDSDEAGDGAGGEVNSVDNITMTVGLAPGSDSIDLTQARLEYLGDSAQSVDLSGSEVTGLNGNGDAILSNSTERAEITIQISGGAPPSPTLANADPLTPGEEAEVKLITQSGATTTTVIEAPDTLKDDDEPVVVL